MSLYPPIEPYESGRLEVDAGHSLYWESCGSPRGLPALFLHSGPGGGCTANSRRLFDPQSYRIILFDQRGCGRSRPQGSLLANTTAHLVSDIETLRRRLGVERWLLLGGSWGAALALAYAEEHLERVSAIVLRGVFTARRSELRWLYENGAAQLLPEAWERFRSPIPAGERHDLAGAYHARLTSGDPALERAAARSWCAWEDELISRGWPAPPPRAAASPQEEARQLALARIEAHYALHAAFLEEGQLLVNARRLAAIPGVIVQGGRDAVTPPRTAFDLHAAWPNAELRLTDAGHATCEPAILRELIAATQGLAGRSVHPTGGMGRAAAHPITAGTARKPPRTAPPSARAAARCARSG